MALVETLDMELKQIDVKTTFLHGRLKEDILLHQPEGFEVQGRKKIVCSLKRSLYGPKQSHVGINQIWLGKIPFLL